MEARLTKQKLLGEFLLEQQEPFALEAFLLERGCSRSLLNGSFVQRSSSWKRKKGVIQLSNLLRAIQHQIGFFNGRSFTRAEHRSGGERVGKCSYSESFSTSHSQVAVEQDGLSSPSSTTVYISCNESSDTEENPNSQNQDGLESEIQERIQENGHFSSSSCRAGLPAKTTEDSTVSASLQEILLHYFKDESGYSKYPVLNQQVASCDYANSKKGLLFDCVMEEIETHKSDKGGLAAEEIGKLICERVRKWGTTSSSETSITELVYDQLLDREEEQVWGDRLTQKMEIASCIADGILGDIRYEILADMSMNTSPCNKYVGPLDKTKIG